MEIEVFDEEWLELGVVAALTLLGVVGLVILRGELWSDVDYIVEAHAADVHVWVWSRHYLALDLEKWNSALIDQFYLVLNKQSHLRQTVSLLGLWGLLISRGDPII